MSAEEFVDPGLGEAQSVGKLIEEICDESAEFLRARRSAVMLPTADSSRPVRSDSDPATQR